TGPSSLNDSHGRSVSGHWRTRVRARSHPTRSASGTWLAAHRATWLAAHGAGTITSRSKPDSAPQASPDRPSICRTLARSWLEGKLSNFSVTGSNRTMALMLQSVSQTLSLSSTHTEYVCALPGSFHSRHAEV